MEYVTAKLGSTHAAETEEEEDACGASCPRKNNNARSVLSFQPRGLDSRAVLTITHSWTCC